MNRLFLLLACIFCICLSPSFSQSVSLSKTVFTPGERIAVTYSGFPGNQADWISIAKAGSPDPQYISWVYTEGNRSGTMTFDGLSYGDYEVRGYYNGENTIRTRMQFRVGNVDQNLVVRTSKPSYLPNEKIIVEYSGLPGHTSDWISIAKPDMVPATYIIWFYTDGKQSGTLEFPGQAEEGTYEVRAYFNNESEIRSRHAFTISNTPVAGKGNVCRTELSTFYAGMSALGLAWGRLGSDVIVPVMITDVQMTLNNAITGIQTIPCLDFQVQRIRDFSNRLPGLTREQAVNEIDHLIKELGGSIHRARVTCDFGASLESLFTIGIHLGASQAIANTFVCRTIPADWQMNLRNHLSTAGTGIAGYSACIPGVNPAIVSNVPVGAINAYEPFSFIVGIQMQVLWAVSLSDCCCRCG